MAGWSDRLKGLLGGTPKPAVKTKPAAKTYNPPSNRAEVIAEAMAVYRRERAKAQGVLEKALKDLLAKPPKPSDIAGMTRLLSLRQAVLSMKGHMTHGPQRSKVLAGIKGLLESKGSTKPSPATAASPKDPPRRPPSQGSKR